jgi:hypothetical protein
MKNNGEILRFLELIKDNSFDLPIRMLQEKGSKVANAWNGESALMLATVLKPVSKAIELIDALMEAGACMYVCESVRYFGHVLFYACKGGVDPTIFDKLIMWDSMRENRFQKWWSLCDYNGNGVFVLACESRNISLAEHILSLAFTQHHQDNFLESMPNHILKSLTVHHGENFDERFMVKWLRLLRTYVDEIPQEYTIGKNNIDGNPTDEHLPHNGSKITLLSDPTDENLSHNGSKITLSGPFLFALRNGMYDFIEEYAALFNADYKYKETIWRWLHEKENRSLRDRRPMDTTGRYAVPTTMRQFALSYEKSELWKRNKDITLVLLRALKEKYQSDILEHVSSFVYTTSFAAKAWDEEKRDANYCCEYRKWYVGHCLC